MNYFYITGTSEGIGRAIAEELLKEENNFVVGLSRKESLRSENYSHHQIDLSSTDKVAAFEFEDHQSAERLVLINNAATLGEVNHIGELSSEAICKAFNVNLVAPAILMNNFIMK